ncbi:MAG TPA: phosphosulfolactate synthase [Sporichthyaceae bacterium]|nr:phosphosulfolactate synthase [Sporichthyaceae bacterium]
MTEPTEPEVPGFLDLPPRAAKPRASGLTHMLDKGLPEQMLASVLEIGGDYIDIVKLGWGTAYVTPQRVAAAKAARCRAAGVHISPGGTLFELAVSQDRTKEFATWCAQVGFDTIEISDGTVDLGAGRRRRLIRELAQDFRVLTEVGCKDSAVTAEPSGWVSEMLADLDAGASYVIAEGRESGTVGVYDSAGRPRKELIEAVLAGVPAGRIIFEAPTKAQQAWFVERLGAEANLGNVAPDDVIGVETLRRGLRADTVALALSTWTNAWAARELLDSSG